MKQNKLLYNIVKIASGEEAIEEKPTLKELTKLVKLYQDSGLLDLDTHMNIAKELEEQSGIQRPFRLRHPTIAGLPQTAAGIAGTVGTLAATSLLLPIGFSQVWTGDAWKRNSEIAALRDFYKTYQQHVKSTKNKTHPLTNKHIETLLQNIEDVQFS